MMVGNSRKQIKVMVVACIGAAVVCLYSAQASSQNLPNALFRPTIEDVDPGMAIPTVTWQRPISGKRCSIARRNRRAQSSWKPQSGTYT